MPVFVFNLNFFVYLGGFEELACSAQVVPSEVGRWCCLAIKSWIFKTVRSHSQLCSTLVQCCLSRTQQSPYG